MLNLALTDPNDAYENLLSAVDNIITCKTWMRANMLENFDENFPVIILTQCMQSGLLN